MSTLIHSAAFFYLVGAKLQSPEGTAECVHMSYVTPYHHYVFSTKERAHHAWPSGAALALPRRNRAGA